MQIPKQIKVGRLRYNVVKLDTVSNKHVGGINYDQRVIVIGERNPHTKKLQSPRQQAHTFWHEVTHAILKDMDHRLEANEQFVDDFARRLNDAIHNAKF